jgi:hypothetical protein
MNYRRGQQISTLNKWNLIKLLSMINPIPGKQTDTSSPKSTSHNRLHFGHTNIRQRNARKVIRKIGGSLIVNRIQSFHTNKPQTMKAIDNPNPNIH